MIEVLDLILKIRNNLAHFPHFGVFDGNIGKEPLNNIIVLILCKMLLSSQVFALLFKSLVLILAFEQLLSQREYLTITLF